MKHFADKTIEFRVGNRMIKILVPEPAEVRKGYRQQKDADAATPFPYWAKIWPAAMGLSQFLDANPGLVSNKTVLELAAGLALPSLVAAVYAREVMASDYLFEAVEYMSASVILNGFTNIKTLRINWHQIPPELDPDLILMSDVNYEPGEFDQLREVVGDFLKRDKTIILSTPQRLMAKRFIAGLLPFCSLQETIMVDDGESQIPVSILVLKK